MSYTKTITENYRLFNPRSLVNNYLQTGSKQAHKVSDFLSEGQLHCLEGFYQQLEHNRLIISFIADHLEVQHLLLLEEEAIRSFSPESLKLLSLTKREAEVLFWISMSKSNPEIANILGCSDQTVKKHLEHIYEKFEVKGRTAAIVYALDRLGMLS